MWPALSARVRENKASPSGLQYLVPTTSQLASDFEKEEILPITKRQFLHLDESHRSVSSYWSGIHADPANGISIYDAPDKAEQERIVSANAFSSFKELVELDRTLVTVQITSFSDATLVCMSVNHILGDGFGIKNIYQAWADLLAGKEPAAFEDMKVDPFEKLNWTHSPPPARFQLLSSLDKIRLVGNILYDSFMRPERTIEQKYVFIPEEEIKVLHHEANENLYQANGKKSPISRSNVIFAWLLKQILSGRRTTETCTPVTIASGRGRQIAGINSFPNKTFAGAAVPIPLTSATVAEYQRTTVGQLSLRIRTDIEEQTTPQNLRDLFAFNIFHGTYARKLGKKLPKPQNMPFFCPPNHSWVGLTDWRAFRLPDIDFSPAALDGKRAYVMAVHTYMVSSNSLRDRWGCIGECAGGTWVTGWTSKAEWHHAAGFGRYPNLSKRYLRRNRL